MGAVARDEPIERHKHVSVRGPWRTHPARSARPRARRRGPVSVSVPVPVRLRVRAAILMLLWVLVIPLVFLLLVMRRVGEVRGAAVRRRPPRAPSAVAVVTVAAPAGLVLVLVSVGHRAGIAVAADEDVVRVCRVRDRLHPEGLHDAS